MAVAEFAGRACDDDDASFSFSSPPKVRNRVRVCYASFTIKIGLGPTHLSYRVQPNECHIHTAENLVSYLVCSTKLQTSLVPSVVPVADALLSLATGPA